MTAQTGIAHSTRAIEHHVIAADQNVIVGSEQDRDPVLFEIRGVQDGERDLPMHEINVHDVRVNALAEGLEFIPCLF